MVKDQEYLEKKASYCIDLAKKLGATDVSVNVGSSISETVNFRNKKLDESNRSDNLGVDITTFIGKKKSSISSSNLLIDNLNTLIEKCIETTKNTPEDEFNALPDKDLLAKEVRELNLYDESHIDNNDKIKYLSRLETSVSNDKKIVNTESSFTEDKSNFILANSDGFCKGFKTSSFIVSSVAVAKDDKSMERDYEYTIKCHLDDIKSAEELGKAAAENTIRKLSPKKIGSEKIAIIFDKRIARGILSTFASAISSSSISRGTSFLKDKKDQTIFSNEINVFDKPDIIKGLGSRSFDAEGVKTNTLQLVEQGILKHYLVDTYNGKISYEELLNSNSKCLYITETIGHGSNIITGDYSVGATGFLVENGEFKYPINEITIAGNFKTMFQNITLANNLEFEYSANSPTMMIEGMVVAGK